MNVTSPVAEALNKENYTNDQSGSFLDPRLMVVKTTYSYSSRESDIETGLNFYRARFYIYVGTNSIRLNES